VFLAADHASTVLRIGGGGKGVVGEAAGGRWGQLDSRARSVPRRRSGVRRPPVLAGVRWGGVGEAAGGGGGRLDSLARATPAQRRRSPGEDGHRDGSASLPCLSTHEAVGRFAGMEKGKNRGYGPAAHGDTTRLRWLPRVWNSYSIPRVWNSKAEAQ
jgi:hypothetical protein